MLIRIMVVSLCFLASCPAFLTAQTPDSKTPLQYTPLQTPCRAVDTRVTGGPIASGTSRLFNPAGGACNIPLPSTGPIVYALNVTAVPHGPLGYLTLWPAGGAQPLVSTLNSPDGRVKANAALITGGTNGEISVYTTSTTDLVLDVSGYFTYNPNSYDYSHYPQALVYVPITPCRVVDTRINSGTSFGAPSLVGGQQRIFQLGNSTCNLPASTFATVGGAIAMNVTAVPPAGKQLSYLTVWGTPQPTEEMQTPLASTLNAPTGAVTANAALVTINPGTSESISVYPSDNTDVVIDITGYFAPPAMAPKGMSLFTLPPCRLLDTRKSSGEFQGELTVPFTSGNSCDVPVSAQAYVVNATVVPEGVLGFLALWPDGTPQPLVSTLNAADGLVTSNMAIVSTANSSIDAFASSGTQLILDVSDYFAPSFTLFAGPSPLYVGQNQPLTIGLLPENGFSDPASIVVSVPAGVSLVNQPLALLYPGSPQILRVAGGANGQQITVTATADGITEVATVPLMPVVGADFSVALANPDGTPLTGLTLAPGQGFQFNVKSNASTIYTLMGVGQPPAWDVTLNWQEQFYSGQTITVTGGSSAGAAGETGVERLQFANDPSSCIPEVPCQVIHEQDVLITVTQ